MTSATDSHVLVRALVDELTRCGMSDAVTSPGSRSAPLLLALTAEPRLRCHSVIDERSAGFFALGLAKAQRRPVAVACTSGTAAAELAPAVIEAHEARVPVIALTADRPPELREVGAGQAIDQLKLYGSAAKWFFEVGTHAAGPERERWIRALACRAFWTALEGRPGPVHLNFPLREPLVPRAVLAEPGPGRPGGRPWLTRPAAPPVLPDEQLGQLASELTARPRGVIVAGRSEREQLGAAAPALAERAGYPLLADPLSGARVGPCAIAHYDALLRDPGFAESHAPELVLRVGDLPTSKPLRSWLAALPPSTIQIAIDPESAWQDPAGVVATVIPAALGSTLRALERALDDGSVGRLGRVQVTWSTRGSANRDRSYLEAWQQADRAAAAAIAGALGESLSEPRVAAELGTRLPAEATLCVASSMPVRDLETFMPARTSAPRVLSNRGANGIDGTISTAFGVAAAGPGPVVLLIGDVALTHDVGGLLAGTRLGLGLTIVLLDNGGGGIFDFLPVADAPAAREIYEQHVATPPGLDFARLAALAGAEHVTAADPEGLRAALDAALGGPGTTLIEVRGERGANVELHRRVWAAVAAPQDR